MSDLGTFLNARLDDDEDYLRTMTEVGQRKAGAASPQDTADMYGVAMAILSDPAAQAVIEQWVDGHVLPPNETMRLLSEIEAKRAILARYDDCLARQEDPGYPAGVARDQAREYEDFVLPGLVCAYSGHPDYEQDWKP